MARRLYRALVVAGWVAAAGWFGFLAYLLSLFLGAFGLVMLGPCFAAASNAMRAFDLLWRDE